MARRGNTSHRRRIARWVAATVAAAGQLLALPVIAQGQVVTTQDRRDLTWSVELGAAGATPFVEDGNGVTTRAGLGVFLGAGVSLEIRDGMSLTAGVRGSTGPLRVESSGSEWRAGRTHRYDVRLGVETGAARHLGIAVSAFGARVRGPDDVIPFRSGAGRIPMWGAEVAGHVSLVRAPYIGLLIAGDVARIGSQRRENPPLAAGWVARLRLGVRHELP